MTNRLALSLLALAAMATPAMPLAAAPARDANGLAPYTVVETGKIYERLQDAVNAIGSGKGTIRFASMRFADCAVQKAGDITYRAAVPG